MVGLLIVLWSILIALGRQWQGTRQLQQTEKHFARVILCLWLGIRTWRLLPPQFDPAYSLPLEFCDLLALLVPLVFLWPRRLWKALIYFWGLGLSVQGIFTPDLQAGPDRLGFWLFWLHHAVIVGTALYIVMVHHFRPTWQDYRLAVSAGLAYVAIVFPIDCWFGFNYGYVGPLRPARPSLIDFLGPWPWRVAIMALLAALAMALLLLPWELYRYSSRQSG